MGICCFLAGMFRICGAGAFDGVAGYDGGAAAGAPGGTRIGREHDAADQSCERIEVEKISGELRRLEIILRARQFLH